jgi:hypothetical protein
MNELFAQLETFITEKNLCIVSINRAVSVGATAAARAGERRLEWLTRAIANIFSQLDSEVSG